MLKIYANNIQVLHRNLIGSNWNSNHERLQKYYEKVQECLDSMVEILMSLGFKEPTLKESLEYVDELEVINRSAEESFRIVQSYFQNIIAEMNRMINIPNDVISKMEEYQVWFRLEANYKLKQELGDQMLTPKQEKFVRNLVSGMSQYDAYRNSYNAKNMKRASIDQKAWELFSRVEIKDRYKELIDKANQKVEVKAEDILRELKSIAFANGADFAEIKGSKVIFKNTNLLDDDKKRAIASIKKTKNGKQVDTYDKLKAIELLVKYTKMFENGSGNDKEVPTLNIVVTDNSKLEKILYEEKENE